MKRIVIIVVCTVVCAVIGTRFCVKVVDDFRRDIKGPIAAKAPRNVDEMESHNSAARFGGTVGGFVGLIVGLVYANSVSTKREPPLPNET